MPLVTLVVRCWKRSSAPGKYDTPALVRDFDRAKTLREKLPGVQTLVASYPDYAALEAAARDSDTVVHTAESADNLDACKAIVRGLQAAAGKRATPAIYVHTSGTGVLSDTATGQPANPRVYSDTDTRDIDSLAETQPHRRVDLHVLNASKGGGAGFRTVILCPPLIYGLGSGAFNTHSQQVPTLIKAALAKGRAVHAGSGDNLWNNVHVRDLARAYALLLDRVVAGDAAAPTNAQGYYFVENGEHSFRSLVADIALALETRGIGDGKPHTLGAAKAEIAAVLGEGYPDGTHMLAGNSRSRAVLLRKLGWAPQEKSLGETILHEVAYWCDQQKK